MNQKPTTRAARALNEPEKANSAPQVGYGRVNGIFFGGAAAIHAVQEWFGAFPAGDNSGAC